MNLRDLAYEITRLAAANHSLTPVNCEGVAMQGGECVLDFDTAELDAKVEELTDSNAGLEKQLKDADANLRASEREEARLAELLDEVREAPPGQTLREYRDRAEKAEQTIREQRVIFDANGRELVAMRKKKGVTTNLFANESEILSAIAYANTYYAEPDKWRARFAALLAKLHAP